MTPNLFDTPELGPSTITLRKYQEEAIDAARECLKTSRSTMILLPTGTGKTYLFCAASRMTAERGGRTLVVVGREVLAYQTGNALERFGLTWGLEMGESSGRQHGEPHVVVATYQTLRKQRLAGWPPDYFRLIVVDECHHATSASYAAIFDHFRVGGRPIHRIGVTATPDRSDEESVSDVFTTKAYEMDIWTAIKDGHLSPLRFMRCDTPIDLRGLKGGREDYSDADVAERITPMVEVLANAIKSKIEDRQTIVFTPDCKSASAMASALQSLNCNADFVWGDSPDKARKIESYTRGETRILVNAMLLTEGFDAPHTSAIVPLRPTKSRGLFSQMVGRGTRLAPAKDYCLVLDFPCLTDELDLVRPRDMLFGNGDESQEESAILDEIIETSPEGVDLVEAAERAGKEKSRRDEMRIKIREREDRLKWSTIDPLRGAFELLDVPYKASAHAIHAKPSQRVVETLAKLGVPSPDQLSRANAKRMMDRFSERRRQGLASFKQTRTLARNGVPVEEARSMRFEEASARIDAIAKSQGWDKRPPYQARA